MIYAKIAHFDHQSQIHLNDFIEQHLIWQNFIVRFFAHAFSSKLALVSV